MAASRFDVTLLGSASAGPGAVACPNCAAERAARERAEARIEELLTAVNRKHDLAVKAESALAAERKAHEETRRWLTEAKDALADAGTLMGKTIAMSYCTSAEMPERDYTHALPSAMLRVIRERDAAEDRLAAALDDRAFLLELLGITVKTGTKDPLLDARLAEARAFLAGGKTK